MTCRPSISSLTSFNMDLGFLTWRFWQTKLVISSRRNEHFCKTVCSPDVVYLQKWCSRLDETHISTCRPLQPLDHAHPSLAKTSKPRGPFDSSGKLTDLDYDHMRPQLISSTDLASLSRTLQPMTATCKTCYSARGWHTFSILGGLGRPA